MTIETKIWSENVKQMDDTNEKGLKKLSLS